MKYNHYIGQGFDRWLGGDDKYTVAQKQALGDWENSFILLSGSYRSGKSEIASRLAHRHAIVFPQSKVYIVREHLASIKKSTLLTFLQLASPDWVADWSNTDLTFRYHNGSTVTFLGCNDPDKIGSIEASFIFVDEAHEISEESFGMLQGRLSLQVQLPEEIDRLPKAYREYALGVVNNNQMFLACNPKDKGHWLYKHFIEHPKPNHICYKSNSISNPNLPQSYLLNNLSAYVRDGVRYGMDYLREAIRKIRAGEAPADGLHLMPALNTQGQRNLLGQWVASEGLVFSLDERDHFISLEDYGEQIKNLGDPMVYGAVDWGYQNPRIVIAEYYEETDQFYIVKYWSQGQTPPSEMILRMRELTEEYDVWKWFLPPDQPGLIKEAKKVLGAFACSKAKNAVLPGINACYTRFSHRRLLMVNDGTDAAKLCYEETSGYQWKSNKNGDRTDEVVKEKDHYPDAIRYLVYSLDYKRKPDYSDDY
ncbi:putative phage terminase large subunit [Acaryochloris phage A-HIS2]|nr:putative phage terminase large subunit [Acaryochloris phage A-HIS2]